MSRAALDYLVAESFSVPERFHVTIGAGRGRKRVPVAHLSMLQGLDSAIALFEYAIQGAAGTTAA